VYRRGKARLFYHSKNNTINDIKIKIITPLLEERGPWPMINYGDGLYYIDIWFTLLGSHVFFVYENGEQVHKNILVVDGGQHIIYPDTERMV